MAVYIPILKVILPYLAPLVQAAAPIFTKTSEKEKPQQSLQDKQISELQSAVQKNSESLQTLASQLQQTIEAFDERELTDKNDLYQINSSLAAINEENTALSNALEKSIKDIQITKYLSLVAIISSFIALGFQVFKN